jgi:hypothetical protein
MGQAHQPHRPDFRARRAHRAQQVRDQHRTRLSTTTDLFRFAQVELPWALGPPDGRYLLRRPSDPADALPAHVLVLATLGAPERRRRLGQRKRRQAEPAPAPEPVSTGQATIIDVGDPLPDEAQARAWLASAGEDELGHGLAVLNRALHAFRLVTADPYLHEVARDQALVARIGFGAGEQVAEGQWTEAHELVTVARRQRRAAVLQPQAHLAAILSGRHQALACEELALRARLDLDHSRDREAALQVLVALDATLAELALDPTADVLSERLSELRGRRDSTALAAQAALAGSLDQESLESIRFTLQRIESALRARAVANS